MYPLHAETIVFHLVLMRAYYNKKWTTRADIYFSKALAVLEHHWGPFHPLQITVYGLMANMMIESNLLSPAMHLLESSLSCCLSVLGPNHIVTAEVHVDLGKLQVRTGMHTNALQHFKQSYLVYKSYFGGGALDTAKSALQVACIQED